MNIVTLKGHTDWVWTVVFSLDSKILASASDDKMIRLWKVDTGQSWGAVEGQPGTILSVAFSTDGRMLAWAGVDGDIRLWKPTSAAWVSGQATGGKPIK